MEINYNKTKLLLFNPGQARDFGPKLELSCNIIELVEETKLLGVVIRSDLSWSSNTEFIISRANKKLWCLRRLKALHTWTIFDLWSAIFKQGGILRICIDNNPRFYSNGYKGIKTKYFIFFILI